MLWFLQNRNIWACPGQWMIAERFSSGSATEVWMHSCVSVWMHVYVDGCGPWSLLLSNPNWAPAEVSMSTPVCLPLLTTWPGGRLGSHLLALTAGRQVIRRLNRIKFLSLGKKSPQVAVSAASCHIHEHSLLTKEQTHLLLLPGRQGIRQQLVGPMMVHNPKIKRVVEERLQGNWWSTCWC